MSEARSSDRHWRLTVWFESSSDFSTFDFDREPDGSGGTKVVSYHGEREGRAVRVNVSIDRVSAWSLEEISR